jgi:hypothetical protein
LTSADEKIIPHPQKVAQFEKALKNYLKNGKILGYGSLGFERSKDTL